MIYRFLAVLPLRALYALAGVLHLCLYRVAGYRKELVRENLKASLDVQSENELTILTDSFYRQLCDTACEVLRSSRISAAELGRRVRLVNSEDLQQWCAGGPIILVSLHKNNWEWLLLALNAQFKLALDPLYKPQHHRGLDYQLNLGRSRFGARPIATGEIRSELLRRRQLNRGYCLLADQAPVATETSRKLLFLGRETRFQAGLEKLARLTTYPVIFADMNRLRRGYYEVSFELLLEAGQDPVQQTLMERYVHACEKAILRQPESWLWSHNRWKC